MESCPEPWKCQGEKEKCEGEKEDGQRRKEGEKEKWRENEGNCPLENAKNFQRYREITESDFWERLLGNIYVKMFWDITNICHFSKKIALSFSPFIPVFGDFPRNEYAFGDFPKFGSDFGKVGIDLENIKLEVTMRKKDYKGRCEKRVLDKCKTVFKSYDPIQSAYADLLEANEEVIEIQCNVPLVGRPVMTACVDAFSGLCCGYSLGWEGGTYSLRGLMLNVIANKQDWCRSHGVFIENGEWDACQMPGVLVTDMGSEYKGDTFSQVAELGIKVVNLPPYRPELKGMVEKFFDVIQNTYKKHLKGKGVIEPDYQERGAHDYRKDACLTLREFEQIILHCIVYYNCRRVIDFPFTEEMLADGVKPYASEIFAWGRKQMGANLIDIEPRKLILTLLPRTTGKFTRKGLQVNGLRYRHDDYTEAFLSGGEVTVAYNPEDVTEVWIINQGEYVPFILIESRFSGKTLDAVRSMQKSRKQTVNAAAADHLQAQINLAEHIQVIANKGKQPAVDIKGIRSTRKREQARSHIDFVKEGAICG